MERHRRDEDAARDELRDQLGGERPRRARHLGTAGVASEDGLVGLDRELIRAVAIADRPPVRAQVVLDGPVQPQPRHHKAAAAQVRGEQLGRGGAGKGQPCADPGAHRTAVGGAQLHDPVAAPHRCREMEVDRLPVQPGAQGSRQRGGRVHDEEVARAEEVSELVEAGVHERAVAPACDEHRHVRFVGAGELEALCGASDQRATSASSLVR
jgi:hypothetical protein